MASTGWHVHLASHAVFLDVRCHCSHRLPRLVLDPVTARDTIARALMDASMESAGFATPTDLADAVLAALASQERGE